MSNNWQENKILLYIVNLKYAHFTHILQYPFSILYLPTQIQMDIVYRKLFKH